ncbi:MAG TPA: protein kinase, partial [Rudaea sp.]|nr:protein kinase [Rudaea sp.]
TIETTPEVPFEQQPEVQIGPWRLVSKLGSGGMGVVWLAERADGQFEQRAAIKLIKRGMDSEAVLKRFLRERQILARLVHPHIAHLLDGGISADGRPYFAMEYVEGLPLLRYCHDRGMQLEERIRLFLRICEAVQFAHVNHVVHRDLKPSNILVTAGGDVKLLDFGIAKLLAGDAVLEETITELQRERPMTPMYAAPEQIRGERITEATDVYALGCVLYEVLTGQHARDVSKAANIREVQQIVETTDPVAPSRLKLASMPVAPKRLRGDLDTIVLTALRREPARRYPSAAAFAADLKSFLDGKPILARGDNVFYRAYKRARKHRLALAAGMMVAVIGIAAVLFELRDRGAPPRVTEGASTAIVDFNNLSQSAESAWLAPALAEMLATELAAGGKVHVLPDELVRPARSDLAVPRAGGYSIQSLATLRRRLGADYVLSGSYLITGAAADARLRFDVALQDTRSGVAIASISQSGALPDLTALVEQAGASLREKSGFAPARLSPEQSTDKAQPPNADVARYMGAALDALRRSDPAKAKDALVKAITLAPGFAPAYVQLAQAWKLLGYDAKAIAAARQAAANSEGLPAEQRLRIDREVAVQTSDWPHAVDLDRQLLAGDPRNPELHFALIKDLTETGKVDEAEAALKELSAMPAVQGDPRIEIKAVAIADKRGDNLAQEQHAEAALKLAQARDYAALAADAVFDLAKARYALGKSEEGVALMRRAADEYRKTGNPGYEGDATTWLAWMYLSQGRTQDARNEYQNALAIYVRIDKKAGIGAVYKNLNILLWNEGDRDAAEQAAHEVQKFASEIGDQELEAWALTAIASIEMDDAATEQVLQGFRAAIALNDRIGAHENHIYALQNYAEALRLRGQLAEAGEACSQAQAEADRSGSKASISLAKQRCALVALDRGDVAAAVGALESVLATATEIEDMDLLANSAIELARVDMARQRWAEADKRLQLAIEKSATLPIYEANAQSLMAQCRLAQGQRIEAEGALARARELRSRITVRGAVFVADVALAKLNAPAGETSRVAESLLALAADAEKRFWIGPALDARLAALAALEAAHAASAGDNREKIAASARQHGYGWVLARLQASPGPAP